MALYKKNTNVRIDTERDSTLSGGSANLVRPWQPTFQSHLTATRSSRAPQLQFEEAIEVARPDSKVQLGNSPQRATTPLFQYEEATEVARRKNSAIQADVADLTKQRDQLMAELGFLQDPKRLAVDTARLDKTTAALSEIDQKMNALAAEKLVNEKAYGSKVKQDTFLGQSSANMALGRLSQEQGKAWARYASNPTAENRKTAEAYDDAIAYYVQKNAEALDDKNVQLGIISKDFMGYVPQAVDQMKSQIPGAVVGGAIGLAVGRPVMGAKIGSALSSGVAMYDITRGQTFKRLLDLGLDEDTARDFAQDEGIVNGLIESADTYLDWTMLGGLAMAKKFFPDLARKASTKAGKTAVTKAAKVLSDKLDALPGAVRAMLGYSANIGQEYAEEYTQGAVSLATDSRAGAGAKANVPELIRESVRQATDPRNFEELHEQGKVGASIALVSGGLHLGANAALGRVAEQAQKGKGVDKAPTTAQNNKQAPVSPAAAPQVQQMEAQEKITRAENPESDVLDTATTLFVEQGMLLKTAQKKAKIVQDLIDGKDVDVDRIKELEPTNPKARELFTQLTGVQFPDGKLSIEQLYNLYRSANTVAQEARVAAKTAEQRALENANIMTAQFNRTPVSLSEQMAGLKPNAENIQQLTPEQILERAAEARKNLTPEIEDQARGDIAPGDPPLLSYKDFSARHKQVFPDASPQETARMYDLYLKDNQARNTLRSAPDGDKLDVAEMDALFDMELEAQSRDGKDATEHSVENKEDDNGKRENSVHREGLPGQPDQRARRQSGSISGETGRTEGDGRAWGRSGEVGGSQAGRGVQESLPGADQKSEAAFREVKVGNHTVHEVRPEAYTPELRELEARFNGTGASVHFVLEGYPVDKAGNTADGITVQYEDGRKEVYLQLVGGSALAERADHELGHVAVFDNPQLKEAAIVALVNEMSEDELLEMANAYMHIYGAAYANSKDLVGDILEEIICDAYAGLNRVNAGAPKYRDVVSGVLEAQMQTYSASYRAETVLTDDAGNLIVDSDGKGHSSFSMRTYKESGRDILTQWLGRAVVTGDLTATDADDIINTLDLVYDICEEARGDYAPFDSWSEAKVVVNEQGNPVFSVVKANGDYAMNLDFSLVCKKRRTLDAVLNELVRRGFVDNLALNEKQIVKINELIRSYGFETACDLCFVDAKRYRQGKVADDFVKLYNNLVLSMVPKNSGLQPQYFNFGRSALVTNDGAGIHELADAELDFTKIDKVLATKGEKTVEYKTAMLLKNSPADRKLTMRGDFLSTRGFDAINRENPRVLKLFNSKKGSGGPKSAVSDVQYLNEVLTSKTFTPEKAYAVGGVRIQSFSDYVPRMVFDYVQMIADLAAKKLPAHAYTKEELFVKQFGLTGMKINMSLIPKVVDGGIAPGLDADGNYAWADESFDFEEAKKIQSAEGYSRNCGTIAVGVSDEHIRTLMADPDIRMVIPYHKSGLSPIVAKMNKIDQFVNYTDFQNTRRPNGKHGKKLSKDVAADKKLLDEMPDFNTRMRELGDPRAAAEEYVRWCEEHDLLPKFDQFAYKQIDGVVVEKDGQRVVDENYYKLLEDFTVYDNGQYVEQSGLTMAFPDESGAFGSMKDLIKRGLEEDALLEAKRDENVSKIVNDIAKMKFSAAGETAVSLYRGKDLAADSDVYTYSFLTAQPDMIVTEMPNLSAVKVGGNVSREKAVELGFENARRVGTPEGENLVSVKNRYTGRNIRIGEKGLRHGLDGDNVSRLRTNARLSAVAGDIIQNAIPVNALKNKKSQLDGTYAMAALLSSGDKDVVAIVTVERARDNVLDIDFVDIAHSINGRLRKTEQGSWSSTRDPASTAASASSTISVADFLEIVKETHQSILSADVLAHFGEVRNPAGNYVDQVKFSVNTDSDYMAAMENEKAIQKLESEIEDINSKLDLASVDGLSEIEVRRLRNQLTKSQYELDQRNAAERKAAVRTSLQTVLDNLDNYRAIDLESIANQLTDNAWDDVETLSAEELKSGIREIIQERAGDMSPLEMQSPKFGVYVRKPSTSAGVRYSITNPELSFADQVELVRQNKLNEFLVPGNGRFGKYQPSAVYVAKEPNPLMQELGYGNYPLVVTQQHIRQMMGKREDAAGNVVNEHNHQLTPRQVKILPKLLENPAAVLRAKGRPDSLVFVTTEKDYRGRPVIVPVKANGTQITFDGADGPAHVVTSMYGHDNFAKLWNEAAETNGIFYYNKKRIDPILESLTALSKTETTPGIDPRAEIQVTEIDPLQVSPDTILGQVQPVVKDPGQRKFSITPEFEKWYLETYGGDDVTNAQLKRRLRTAERRAAQAEHDKKAAELKNTIDSEMDLTAWMIHHTKKMREQKREFDEKLKEADKARYEAVKSAVAETKMVERAKAEVQHDADRMAERRNAAKRLHTKENVYIQKIQNLKENLKLKRNAARATLKTKALADKKRAEIEAEQGAVNTIRKDPKTRAEMEKRQSAAEELRFAGREFYRTFISGANAIERFAKRQLSDMRADALINIVGGTGSTIDRVFKDGLYDRAGNRIGDAMREVFLCWDAAHKQVDEKMQALLQDFMLHLHNIDRMGFVAKAEHALRDFEEQHPWLRDMDNTELARLIAMTEKEVEKLGKQEAQALAIEYARLTKNRIEAKNKPIFADDNGNAVSASTSQVIVDQYLAENPWLLEKANGIYEWWDLFMREWAVGDTISEAEYNTMRETYPHYVPTYRVDKVGVGGANFVGAGGATVGKAVKKAKGSFSEVMNIEDSFANLVGKIIKLNRVNELYMNIIDTAMLDDGSTFGDLAYFDWEENDLERPDTNEDLTDTVDKTEKTGFEDLGNNEYKLTGWRDGRKFTAFISKDMYQAMEHVTGYAESEREKRIMKTGRILTTPMKMAITGANPFFALRNFARDVSSAYINGISGIKFPIYLKQAFVEMGGNSEHWQQFQALGGTHAGYYHNEKAFSVTMAEQTNVFKKTLSGLQWINENAESATRFAEYLATLDKLGDTYEARLQGIKNAAEVTVDFSRKGDMGKTINAFVPYWNPAVQGIDRLVRSVVDSPDGSKLWKQATVTLGRAALSTVFWEAVQYALLSALDRDDEWEQLSDRVKDTYYCIPLKNEKKFLKIPKNREWGAILGTPFMRMLEYANGRENPFENYIETALVPNFLPPGITDAVVISQLYDLAKNEDFAGRTIVPSTLEKGSRQYQYDADTSYISRGLGMLIKDKISPMQVDYIIEDYLGDWGELATTITSEAFWKGAKSPKDVAEIFTGTMVADARYSNAQTNSYYSMLDELDKVVQDKKNLMGIDKYKETREYQTQKGLEKMYGNDIAELNRQVREMPDGPEKDELKTQIAQLAAQALEFYEDSMAGRIENPIRTAEYADLNGVVSAELIRLDELSGDYGFRPTGDAEKSYTDPKDKQKEYVLTEDQRDYFESLYRETYDEMMLRMIQSTKYKNTKDDKKKAEMLAELRKEVLKATKEEFFDWLEDNRVRSTPKK